MKKLINIITLIILLSMSINAQTDLYDISINSIDDKVLDLNQYKGKNIIRFKKNT